jgi:hypothetical protein
MPWAGKALEDHCSFLRKKLTEQDPNSLIDAGIERLDERALNMLWNDEV